MSPKLQPVRGTHDILPDEFEKFHAVVTRARELATLYGFKEMATPIFEPTEVFSRSMGETSDVVSKEMFSFETKGGESVTLRPEFTAGIVRAFLSNGMQQHLPLKLFSTGPLFRYERPQKGRQRQFHQVNFEWLGDASILADVQIILLAASFLFSLSKKKNTLLINTLGDYQSRTKYKEILVNYLTPYQNDLSEDSKRRLISNPLRILDSKDVRDQKIIESAPKITANLSDDSKRRFDELLEHLQKNTIAKDMVKISPVSTLVRGLDYYTDTVFEFVSEEGDLGAQNTVLAGGRYDGLVEQMGGKPTPAIGFAAGVERLLLLSAENWGKSPDTNIWIVPMETVSPTITLNFVTMLRHTLDSFLLNNEMKQLCTVEIAQPGKLSKGLEKASKNKANHVIILGEEEAKRSACIIKNMMTGMQREILLADLADEAKFSELLDLKKLDSGLRRNDEAQP